MTPDAGVLPSGFSILPEMTMGSPFSPGGLRRICQPGDGGMPSNICSQSSQGPPINTRSLVDWEQAPQPASDNHIHKTDILICLRDTCVKIRQR